MLAVVIAGRGSRIACQVIEVEKNIRLPGYHRRLFAAVRYSTPTVAKQHTQLPQNTKGVGGSTGGTPHLGPIHVLFIEVSTPSTPSPLPKKSEKICWKNEAATTPKS